MPQRGGWKLSAESRERQSKGRKQYLADLTPAKKQEWVAMLRAARSYDFTQTAEYRHKQSLAHEGRWTEEARLLQGKRLRGRAGRKRGVPCAEGCRCGRHMDKGRPCLLGCSCRRHDEIMREHQRVIRIGKSLPIEQIQKMKASQKARLGHHKRGCVCWVCTGVRETHSEWLARTYLMCSFPEFECQRYFGGKYRVDFYLPPPYHLAIEIGSHSQNYDWERDGWLWENYSLPVIHLTNEEINNAVQQLG